jgi:hypothetical protein
MFERDDRTKPYVISRYIMRCYTCILFSCFKSKENTHLKKAIEPFINRRVMWPLYLVVLWKQRNTIHRTTYLYPNKRKSRITTTAFIVDDDETHIQIDWGSTHKLGYGSLQKNPNT